MKMHTTNYQDTFIAVADDCPAAAGEIPPVKGEKKSVASLQYDLIRKNPYRFTSDDVVFRVFAARNDVPESDWKVSRQQFFTKGQPCLRASPLTKRYGWGVHCDSEGRVALYGRETDEYEHFSTLRGIKVVKAMKSSR